MIIEREIIKMLFKATEIQDKREFTLGNIYFDSYQINLNVIGLRYGNKKMFNSFNFPLRTDKKGYLWIPSQRQLQDMYYNTTKNLNKIEITNLSFMEVEDFVILMDKYGVFFTNHHEIWIAFIMFRLYSKAWVNEEFKSFGKKGKKKNG